VFFYLNGDYGAAYKPGSYSNIMLLFVLTGPCLIGMNRLAQSILIFVAPPTMNALSLGAFKERSERFKAVS
jgi:hypothetical protein